MDSSNWYYSCHELFYVSIEYTQKMSCIYALISRTPLSDTEKEFLESKEQLLLGYIKFILLELINSKHNCNETQVMF